METPPPLRSNLDSQSFLPGSLGKLVEWKRARPAITSAAANHTNPGSLGKLVEWKRVKPNQQLHQAGWRLSTPARWGN